MDFFCLIETEGQQVPYLEWLQVSSLDEARTQARRILREHRRPLAAHIFAGNEQLDVLRPQPELLMKPRKWVAAGSRSGR